MHEEKKSFICRICLNYDITQNQTGFSLFEKYNDTLILDKINYIANVKIAEGDGLPDRICSKCVLDLETVSNFKQKCENSDVVLHALALNPEPLCVDLDNSVKDENLIEYVYEYLNDEEVSVPESETDDAKFGNKNPFNKVIVRKSNDLKLECGSFFKSKCKLRVHWKIVHQQSQLICVNCKATFKSYKSLNIHRKKTIKSCKLASTFHIEGQGKSRVFHCKECNYKSKYIKGLDTHLLTHSETDIHVKKEKLTELKYKFSDVEVCLSQFNEADVKAEILTEKK